MRLAESMVQNAAAHLEDVRQYCPNVNILLLGFSILADEYGGLITLIPGPKLSQVSTLPDTAP